MKKGFTLIEVLVASVLLGMLVTILTMVFNQSSIAWRTGRAGTAELDRTRRMLAVTARQADNLIPLPNIGGNASQPASDVGEVLSPWGENGVMRRRSFHKMCASVLNKQNANDQTLGAWQEVMTSGQSTTASAKSYVVKVVSYGPDRQPKTEDDISSMPEEDDQ
jgi:prepilin-type N-terminal cleavage/methylation domain-containing protein